MTPRSPIVVAASLAALLGAVPTRTTPASTGWPPGGMLVDSVRVDGVIPPFYGPLGGSASGAVLSGGRAGYRRAYRVSEDGVVQPGWPIVAEGTAPVSDGAGGFLQFFFSPAGAGADLWLQHYDASGAVASGWPAAGVTVCSAAGAQWPPFACGDGGGGAFVAWVDTRGGGAYGELYATHVFADGTVEPSTPCGVKLASPTGSIDTSNPCALTPDGAGGFFFAWQQWGGSPTGYRDLRVQRVSASLAPLWTQGGVSFPSAAGILARPRMIADGAGGVFVAWAGSGHVWVQRLDPGGAPSAGWPAAGLMTSPLAQDWPALAADGAGGVIVGWSEAGGPVRALRLGPAGVPVSGWPAGGAPLSVSPGAYPLDVVRDGAGGAIACFANTDGPGPAPSFVLRAQHVRSDGTLAPYWGPNGEIVRSSDVSTSSPVMSPLGSGDAVVMWYERHPTPYPGTHDDKVYAQRVGAYLPTPVETSLVGAVTRPDTVRLTWFVPSRYGEATIYRRAAGEGWRALATRSPDASSLIVYEDASLAPGVPYDFRLGIRDGGVESFFGEVTVIVTGRPALALDPLAPDPSSRGLRVRFTLPSAAPARLELTDVAGRRLRALEVGSLGAGVHDLDLAPGARLAPGVYLVRLTQGAQGLTARASVIR